MRKIIFALILAVLPIMAAAQNTAASVQAAEESRELLTPNVVCGPYLQNVTENSFTVMWASDADAVAWVEIAPDNDEHFYLKERPKYYDMSGCGIKPVGTLHKVKVDGLEPGTSYRYRIMMTAVEEYYRNSTPVYGKSYGARAYHAKLPVVRTLAKDYDKVSFAVVNDVHAEDSLLRRLFADQEKDRQFDFVLFNGDMTSDLCHESKIPRHYLKSASELFACEVPLYMARGNHEWRGAEAVKLLDWFDFPGRKPYYTFKYGRFFFVVLDSAEDKVDSDIENHGLTCIEPYLEQETAWLKEVVGSEDWKNAERRIVFCHIPPAVKEVWYGNHNVSRYFLPVLNGNGVDLMLSGHEHYYELRKAGTVGADFPIIINDQWQRMDVNVTPSKISVRIHDTDGRVAHSVDLQ